MGLPPPPVKLYGEVADNFLESVGVNIFDDGDIAIGESIFDLETGCDILEENGVILCEDCIVLEGKQAEEYKARKAKERADAEEAYELKASKRGNYQYTKDRAFMGILRSEVKKNPNKPIGNDGLDKMNSKASRSASSGSSAWNSTVDDERYKRSKKYGYHNNLERGNNILRANDAANRHKRRHPKQYAKNESTIFSDIEII